MPHIDPSRRNICLDLPQCQSVGELHYFFGQQMQETFLKNPCYATISSLRRFYVQTANRQEMFKKIRQVFRVPLDTVLNEAAMAWEIFEAEVVVPYEDVKALENGHAYQKSLEYIRKKLDEVTAKKQAMATIIVPGAK